MKNYVVALAVLAVFQSVDAQFVGNGSFTGEKRSYYDDGAWAPRERNVDFKHMRLELSFETAQGLVKGKATHLFSPLRETVDSIWLDGPGIRVSAVTMNGKTAKFRSEAEGLWVFADKSLRFGEQDSMSITYECNPRKGLYFIGWNDPQNISRKQIWSQGQGIDNRNWIPFYDEMNDKLTTEMIVTFESAYKVLSNGVKLKEKDNKNGTKTWHYKMNKPHAPYLVMLGIGMYDIKETKSKRGVPMYLYYYPEWKNRVEATYRYSERMVDWFEEETGVNYPWETYSQIPVQEFMYGAMENTTATVFGDFLFVDEIGDNDRGYVSVNAHELAHQWFGDYITARSDAHHWLQESFATYYNQMFEREVYGGDHFDWLRREAQMNSLNASKNDLLPVAHSQSGSVRHYPKGAFVLNMLKYVVGGRDPYNRAIKHYLLKYPYGSVDSDNLLYSFHETTGMSLNWFWEQWVYRGGEPSYNVEANEIADNKGNKSTQFAVEQVHATGDVVGLFKMPIWFEVHYTDGTSDRKMAWIENKNHVVNIPNKQGKEVSYVLFDPNNEVLKTVTFRKPLSWLKNQALKAKNMLDRYDAVAAMKDYPAADKRATLLEVFNKEKFHAVKGEIIRQLINDNGAESNTIISSAFSSMDPQVHKHLINATTTISADREPGYRNLLRAKSYDVIAMTLEKLSYEFPDRAESYLNDTKGVIGISGRNVEIKWLEVKARTSNDQAALDQLVAYTSVSYEFRTRANAAQALKRLNYFTPALLPNLTQAMMSSNGRLAGPCGDVLNFFYGQHKHRRAIKTYIDSQNWTNWQKQAVNRFLQ
jgi:aminopeptidase N